MGDLLLIFLVTGFVTTLFAAILLTIYKRKIAFNERVNTYFGSVAIKSDERIPEKQEKDVKHFFSQYWEKGTDVLNKKVSKEERRRLNSLLRDAGYPFKSPIDFRLFQILLSAVMGLVVFMFFMPIAENKTLAWVMVAVVALLGFRLPIFYLGKKKTARIKAINKAMPDFFDTVNLLLEAGMGLDLALKEVSLNIKGPLADEFLLTLEDMKLGKSRRESFYELRRRVPSHSFQSLITSLIQADQLGIGMAKVLGNLTIRVREQRREAAREQAMKAPVKMLFPMVFFIFPSLFIVILGPLVITLITKGFGG
ncbi:type II secretion system F family protein [Neobacillus rhizophilus]|uniref:Type II secretion system F family protein n=1 Tax=Neobacillus rhizophilus TaxID=2833579 RepID=A0A942YUM7_9BACI|nr:type II secretion system F family protein [Neobacillus rhizophilus]MBS4213284.1 type II secretion system F family protein [Neobacillus rhizophilus]MBU8914603.1 type II secretion system F family protein [Bacillus sp. FJAT-29953]